MDRLWAPWRITYINANQKESGCIFCVKPREDRDAENYVLYRGEFAFILLNLYPYNNGHLMVAPYRHIADLSLLSEEEQAEIMKLTTLACKLLKTACRPDGFNVGANLGQVAGAGIADHLHVHIVPRWNGDTNFMPVISDTKILPQSLADTYAALKAAIDAREKG
jgi:ATP adenylyltransferase